MNALREIPPVHEILRSPVLQPYAGVLQQEFATRLLREVLDDLRGRLAGATSTMTRAELTQQIASTLAGRLDMAMKPSLRRVINATGVVLHTNLGRAPLPGIALDRLREITGGYSNLEFDLESGSRGKRDSHAEGLLRRLLGCEAAVVVNNNAAAVLLVLNTLAECGEVIASRGEQVEIGGSFRIPEVMIKSGAVLREVGTTNRTRIADYERAIGPATRLLLRVHPSNFRMIGFTERPSLTELAELGRKHQIPLFEDLGSGCLLDLSACGIADEPQAGASLQAGVDIISFSGDKLLGGPQAGIIAGKRLYVQRVRQNPLFRALRVDKLTLAVLESVLLSFLRGTASSDVPAIRMLAEPAAALRARAENFAAALPENLRAVPMQSAVGGGSAPGCELQSWGVEVRIEGLSETGIEERLRSGNPPVIARNEDGRTLLDLRTVAPEEEAEILVTLRAIARGA